MKEGGGMGHGFGITHMPNLQREKGETLEEREGARLGWRLGLGAARLQPVIEKEGEWGRRKTRPRDDRNWIGLIERRWRRWSPICRCVWAWTARLGSFLSSIFSLDLIQSLS